jgi:peptide/nickel transport system substrate-binding protein
MKKIWKLLAIAALTLFALTACGGNDAESDADSAGASDDAEASRIVIIGGQSDLVTLDPGNMYEPYANMFSYAAYDMLYRVAAGTMGTPEPSVATGHTVDESGTVYTFPLRDDVVFAGGNKLTAKDVVWSINRVLNMKESNAYATVKSIVSVEAPDDYTVVFTLSEPDASFLVKLTSNAYCILDSEVVKQHGGSDSGGDTAKQWLDQNSAGSGPYVVTEWTPKERVVLDKNPNYWGETANIDTIIFREMPNVDAQITALQNGEIDIALGLNGETAKQLDGVSGVTVTTGTTALMTFLVMSRDESLSPELSNPKVQEAVRLALDYEGYLTLCGEGGIVPLNFVQRGFAGALTRDLDTMGRDTDAARRLMEEAGYKDGFSVTLTCGNNSSEGLAWTTIAEKVKQDLAEIGIDVKIETLEATLVYEKMRNNEMPFYVMFWSPDYYDINNQFAFLPGVGDDGTAYGNRTQWAVSPENQILLDLAAKVQVETDEAKRAEYAEELQREYAKNNPLAFLLQHPKTYAYNSDTLANVTYNDLCKIELCELRVKE